MWSTFGSGKKNTGLTALQRRCNDFLAKFKMTLIESHLPLLRFHQRLRVAVLVIQMMVMMDLMEVAMAGKTC